jgi:hypothetical protein
MLLLCVDQRFKRARKAKNEELRSGSDLVILNVSRVTAPRHLGDVDRLDLLRELVQIGAAYHHHLVVQSVWRDVWYVVKGYRALVSS